MAVLKNSGRIAMGLAKSDGFPYTDLYRTFHKRERFVDNALKKRIKRHLIGREHAFFAITAPGLETMCQAELNHLHTDIKNISRQPGGVEFTGRLHGLYHANLHLRTAGRILMRITTFRVTNFRQLAKKASQIPWELFLNPALQPMLHTSATRSRLFHTTAVEEIIHTAIENQYGPARPSPKNGADPLVQHIFVRLDNDILTLSMDSSGDLLYKRGIKTHGGKAPLRETMAAFALKEAGFDGNRPLIDPMCGTGTFTLEGILIKRAIPPGWFRRFAFMDWPCFQPGRWTHERREAEKQIHPSPIAPALFASDMDAESVEQLARTLKTANLADDALLSCSDFFTLSPDRFTDTQGVITLNPPYGIRLATEKESSRMFDHILKKLVSDYSGWRVALIASEVNQNKRLPFPVKRHPLIHGGLKLTMLIGHIP